MNLSPPQLHRAVLLPASSFIPILPIVLLIIHKNFDNNNHVKMVTVLSSQTEGLSDGGEDDSRGCALSAYCSFLSSSLRFVAALSKDFALAKVITLLSLPTFV